MVLGRRAIRRKDRIVHRRYMLAAASFAALFLCGFIAGFVEFGAISYEGGGPLRAAFYVRYFSHEPLAVVNVFLVLATLLLGLFGSVKAHREIAPMALGIWMYVSVTGIAIYVMLDL